MWLVLLLGVSLHQGCFAQLWSPRWRGQAGDLPWAPNRWGLPVAQPYASRSRAAPVGSHAVAVTCEPRRVVVTAHRDLFGVGRLVAPADLTLGATHCLPTSYDAVANVVVFEAGLHECGSTVQMSPDFLIYRITLFYTPSLANNPVIIRTNAAQIPIECHYPRRSNLTRKAIRPTWAPFRSTVLAEARLGFSLQLMKDDWSAERTSARFQLGDAIRLQADIHTENRRPLRVFADSCVAGLSPEATPVARHAIVDSHGCLADGRQDSVASAFLSPRPRQESLRFTVDTFRFAGDPRNLEHLSDHCGETGHWTKNHVVFQTMLMMDCSSQACLTVGHAREIYITCHLKVTPAEQAPDELNKACSFSAEANSWLPVEGSQGICRCCESQNCGRDSGVQPHGFRPRLETSWQRSLPGAHQAQLVLGPLLVFDAQESGRNFPDNSAEDEETVMEEGFLPVIQPKAGVKGTRFPFKERKGAINILAEEQKVKPAVPWGAYVWGGPILLGEGEGGSGFGEQAEAAPPEESTALEFKAEVVSRPLEDALPSGAPGKFPVEAVNLPAKGPKQPSGGTVLLAFSFLMAGGIVTFLISGALLLLGRCRRPTWALRPSAPNSNVLLSAAPVETA